MMINSALTLTTNPERTPELLNALFRLWRDNVDQTHRFVKPTDLEEIALKVPGALAGIPTLTVAYVDNEPVGFIGEAEQQIEMLFVTVNRRGQGIGSALIRDAIKNRNALTVTVNEQNESARGFYERHGFAPLSRSEQDDAGRPYPILTMRLTDSSSRADS